LFVAHWTRDEMKDWTYPLFRFVPNAIFNIKTCGAAMSHDKLRIEVVSR
jgi:hypothetical protein